MPDHDIAAVYDSIKYLCGADVAGWEAHMRNDEVVAIAYPALARLEAKLEAAESRLRYEWWANHGHDYGAMYGDDGEMQCNACPMDFKRTSLEDLWRHVVARRALAGKDAEMSDNTEKKPWDDWPEAGPDDWELCPKCGNMDGGCPFCGHGYIPKEGFKWPKPQRTGAA